MRSLSNNEFPGLFGVVNEFLTMLPPIVSQNIHKLFTIVWATGYTKETRKTSDTVLIDKEKGEEIEMTSFRPIGLANTLYKLSE